jgi:hypothetical protein
MAFVLQNSVDQSFIAVEEMLELPELRVELIKVWDNLGSIFCVLPILLHR